MRCAVGRASKGYHISKTVYIYKAKSPSINHSGPSVMSNLNQVQHLYFPIITQSISTSTKLHLPISNPCYHHCNLIRTSSNPTSRLTSMYNPVALLMSSRRHYARALYVFQMSWHCAPLKCEGVISLSGNPMRGKPQSVSNQKGSSLCLQSDDCWSQSPICWPMVTVSNLSTRTNNRWLAYQPVIIARWYICLSVMQCPQCPINFNLVSISISTSISCTLTIPFDI